MAASSGRLLTVFLVEQDLELVLVLVLQTLLEPRNGVLVGEVAVHEAAPAGLLHHLPTAERAPQKMGHAGSVITIR